MLHTIARVLWASFMNFQQSTLTLRGDYTIVSRFMNNNLYNICISVLSSDITPTSYVNTLITKTMSKNYSVRCFPDFPDSIVLLKVRTLCPFVLLLRMVLRQMSMEHWWNKAHWNSQIFHIFWWSNAWTPLCTRSKWRPVLIYIKEWARSSQKTRKSDICGIISARLVKWFRSSRIWHNYTLRFCLTRLPYERNIRLGFSKCALDIYIYWSLC